MSPSWSSRPLIRVHLAADALMACEVHAQRNSRRLVRKARFPFAAPGERLAAMRSMSEWVGDTPRGTVQEWVLGIADVRYLLLPWAPDLADGALRSAFAMASFEQQFKQDPSLYAVRFAKPAYGRAQLAAFVPHSLLAQLDAHADASKVRLRSVAPGLVVVWDRFHTMLQKESGVVHVVEGARQIVVRHAKGQMTHVLLRPFDTARQEVAPWRGEPGGGVRVFSASSVPYACAEAALPLADGDGFLSKQDTAYAFALCGVF
ncbi:hypothetical protein D9M72_429220 [compost metagenome]